MESKNNKRRNEFEAEIANILRGLIPCEWERMLFHTEVQEELLFWSFYVYDKKEKLYHWTDIPRVFFHQVNMEEFGRLLNELEQCVKNFWKESQEAESNWNVFSLEVHSNENSTSKFETEIDKELSEQEREVRWVYDEHDILPNSVNGREILKKYLKEQGREMPEELRDKPIRYKERIVIQDTPEKYVKMADELIAFVEEFFRELNQMTVEMYMKDQKSERNKFKLGIPVHIVAPDYEEIWREYYERFTAIAETRCTSKLLKQGYAVSMSNPPEYSYIDKDCQIVFTMKTAKKATIEMKYYSFIEMRQLFILSLTEEGWRISEKKYAHGNEKTWHKTTI